MAEDFRFLTDQQLADLLSKGDDGAYSEIYYRYKGVLFQHVYKKLRSQEEAEDIIQDLFATLWARRDELTNLESLSGYLYTSVRNKVLDFISRSQVRKGYIEDLQHFIDTKVAVTDHLVRENMLREHIEAEIAELPEKMREVFVMSRKLHLSHREIADKLGLSEKTVKNQVNNSLKILRKNLGVIAYITLLMKL